MADVRFLAHAPPHYVAARLAPSQQIVVDGRLDDAAWQNTPWTSDLVDITHHGNSSQNVVPANFQMRTKLRWDADFLYVGAELREPLVVANLTGHNLASGPPYRLCVRDEVVRRQLERASLAESDRALATRPVGQARPGRACVGEGRERALQRGRRVHGATATVGALTTRDDVRQDGCLTRPSDGGCTRRTRG
jgi:hypothetical protein